MSDIGAFLQTKKVLLLDGSFGSQANKYIEKPIDGDPLWSAKLLATNPEAVIKVHRDYINVGCDIIETDTYQASIPGFMKYLELSYEDSYNLIKKGVELARNAINNYGDGKRVLVAGSLGPYGAYLHDGSEYSGYYIDQTSVDTLKEYHRPRMSALIEAGVDLLAIETIPSKKEGEVLVELLKDFPNVKAWLSFSCQSEGVTTVHGDDFGEAVSYCYSLNPEQLVAVGVNCTAPHAIAGLLKEVKRHNDKIPFIVYANSGEKYDPKSGWDNNYERLEEFVPIWLNLGVKILGGCCRICDNYISKIKEQVDAWILKQ